MRQQVEWFANQMESKLQENNHKGGWSDCGNEWLLNRLHEEVNELQRALKYGYNVVSEASDVANFAMMLADNFQNKVRENCYVCDGTGESSYGYGTELGATHSCGKCDGTGKV